MATKKITKKEPTAGEALGQLKKVMKNQKEINSDLYSLILQAGDDGTLRTKINNAHDRITATDAEVARLTKVLYRNDVILRANDEELKNSIQNGDCDMMTFVAGLLFATINIGVVLICLGVL